MRFNLRFILLGVMPYIAVVGAIWSGAFVRSLHAALTLSCYFTLFYPFVLALGFLFFDWLYGNASAERQDAKSAEGTRPLDG